MESAVDCPTICNCPAQAQATTQTECACCLAGHRDERCPWNRTRSQRNAEILATLIASTPMPSSAVRSRGKRRDVKPKWQRS